MWFGSYLINRQQFTVVNDVCSSYKKVITGVPQGSTLGPLLFLLYINDLVKSSTILKFVLFADDTTISHSGSNLHALSHIINTELNHVFKWLLTNKLSLNVDKTHYIIFAGNRYIDNNVNILLGETSIERNFTTKFLGVFIDSRINWREHVRYIHGKLSKSIGVINKIKHNLTKDALLILYYSLLYPYLHYCNVTWGSAQKTILHPLTLMQKKVVRIVNKANYRDHTDHLFRCLGILKIRDINVLESVKFVYDQLHSSSIIKFNTASNVHNRNTRNKSLLRPPKPKSDLEKRFISYSGCTNWNNLPQVVKCVPNKVSFKIQAKKLFLRDY